MSNECLPELSSFDARSHIELQERIDTTRVIQTVRESWRMTSGHTWKVFFIGLLAIPVVIAGLLALLVVIIPAVIWVSLALVLSIVRSAGQATKRPDRQ